VLNEELGEDPGREKERANDELIGGDIDDGEEREDDEHVEDSPPIEDSQLTPTPANGIAKALSPRKISTSRQKALEACQEEYDEDGIAKSSLQHIIINTYRKEYPQGYPLLGEGEPEGEKEVDDNSSFNSALEFQHPPAQDQPFDEEEAKREEEDKEKIEDGDDCPYTTNVNLLGKILLFSSTNVTDSFISTFSFNSTEPVSPLQLSKVDVTAYCMEIGIGGGPNHREGKVCYHHPSSNAALETLLQSGQHILFRSYSSLSDIRDKDDTSEGGSLSSHPSVPTLSLGKEEKQTIIEENHVSPVEEIVSSPISASLLLHEDGSLSVRLKSVGTGKSLYQVNVINDEL
jgi:hypothetical protein